MPKHPKHPLKTEDCLGCREEDCVKHGPMVKAGIHTHAMDIVFEETWWQPLVPGTSTKVFKYPRCGGAEGCGAIFARNQWYVVEADHEHDWGEVFVSGGFHEKCYVEGCEERRWSMRSEAV